MLSGSGGRVGGGAIVYVLGTAGMSVAGTGMALQLFGGILTGLGVAFTAFSITLASMARVVGPHRRSLALGLGSAAGSFGQVVSTPRPGLRRRLRLGYGARHPGGHGGVIAPLASVLPGNADEGAATPPDPDQTLAEAVREAARHRGYVLLTLGFFVCGFDAAFIAVRFSPYVVDLGLDAGVGASAIAIVGLLDIASAIMHVPIDERPLPRLAAPGRRGSRASALHRAPAPSRRAAGWKARATIRRLPSSSAARSGRPRSSRWCRSRRRTSP